MDCGSSNSWDVDSTYIETYGGGRPDPLSNRPDPATMAPWHESRHRALRMYLVDLPTGRARLRLYGSADLGELARRWLDLLPPGQASQVRSDPECGNP